MGRENDAQDAHNKGEQDYSSSRDREINPIRDAIQSPYDPPKGQEETYREGWDNAKNQDK
jgi:hypothetical protein